VKEKEAKEKEVSELLEEAKVTAAEIEKERLTKELEKLQKKLQRQFMDITKEIKVLASLCLSVILLIPLFMLWGLSVLIAVYTSPLSTGPSKPSRSNASIHM